MRKQKHMKIIILLLIFNFYAKLLLKQQAIFFASMFQVAKENQYINDDN